ncbi:hypothetical protein OKA04_09720 [Luteolibacter flavescens]|uniref:Uncharacterized protein n=1 Tax=Luteolibacter flavescens TaxID=1859460 RepID=A0ABT3FP58_9BACT|nr:hypothetical protein [Luteolibacter flavescens]MCW1885004.1 hypothetical protein [Luteolibacter flavescens]
MTALLKSTRVRLGLLLAGLVALTWWLALPSKPEAISERKEPVSAPVAGKWDGHDGATRFAAAVAAATPADWAQLVREALDSGNEEIIRDILPGLLRSWMQADMRGFLAFINELEVLDENGRRWAILGPILLEVIPGLGDQAITSPTLSSIIQRTILNVARIDPETALDWAQQRLAGIEQDRAIAGIIPYLVAKDIESAKSLAAGIQSTPNRLAAQLAIGTYLGANDSAAALAWANSLSHEGDRAYALAAVLSAMAEASPHGAGEIYRDAVAKMQAAFTEKVLADRRQMGPSMDGEFEDMTPAQAEQALRSLPDPNLQYFERAATEIGNALVRNDPAAALAWARSLTAIQGGEAALASVYGAWVSIDPAAAWSQLRTEANPATRVVADFFESWASKDPAGAAGALAELSGTSSRLAAIPATVSGWTEAGGATNDLVRWAGTLPAGQEQDRARGAIASTVAFDDPVVALQQVQQIKDPQKQAAAFGEVFPSLADIQPLTAQKAVQTLPLSQLQKDYFNGLLEPLLNP